MARVCGLCDGRQNLAATTTVATIEIAHTAYVWAGALSCMCHAHECRQSRQLTGAAPENVKRASGETLSLEMTMRCHRLVAAHSCNSLL